MAKPLPALRRVQPPALPSGLRPLTGEQFRRGVSPRFRPRAEWFANRDNPRTRRVYWIDIREFMVFVGIARAEEFRGVTRART